MQNNLAMQNLVLPRCTRKDVIGSHFFCGPMSSKTLRRTGGDCCLVRSKALKMLFLLERPNQSLYSET